MSIVKAFSEALGKQSIKEAIKAGGYRIILDGNLEQTILEQGVGSKLIGTDRNGNRYFEKLETESSRDRWVVYGDTSKTGQDPALVPPEWHAWLHHISDANPENSTIPAPVYQGPALGSQTNTPNRHQPKGSWFAQKRNWIKYQTWDASSAPPRFPKA